MRAAPTVPGGLKDQTLQKFLTDVAKCLATIPDINIYTTTAVWKVPFELFCPLPSGQGRVGQPSGINLIRAVLVSAPETAVYWDASTTWSWMGRDTAKITDQSGLVEGVRYTLVFQVTG